MLRTILAAVAVLGLLACGGESYDTKRDAAIAVFDALCSRAAECGEIGTAEIQGCIDALVGDFCQDFDCNAAPASPDSAINDCIDSIAELSCTAEDLPARCNSIL